MHIQDLQAQAKELREAQGWTDSSLERRSMFLVTEVGEVVQETLRLTEALGKQPEADLQRIRDNLGMEIYDVVWNLCDLANLAGIDLDAAFAMKAAINRSREW